MRSLHVSSAMSWQGGEQQIAYLIEVLALKGHQQWILCPKGSAMEVYCLSQNIPHFTYKKITAVNPLVGKKIDILSDTYDIELIHLHDAHAHTYGCMAASLFKMRMPIVLSRRIDFPMRRNPLSKWKYNHPGIHKIICVSNFIKSVMEADIKDDSKLTVVHSGIDFNRFAKTKPHSLRKEFKVSDQSLLIANIAELTADKDYITYVNTAELLLEKNKDLHFFIIGSPGSESDEVSELITQKKLANKITLTGHRNDIPDLLSEIDILLSTSIREGLGISIIEAQLCQVPVVATRVGGIPEIIEHERTGLLAPAGNPEKLASEVQRLINDESLRSKLAQNAFNSVKSFSKEIMTKKTIAIYKEVIAQA